MSGYIIYHPKRQCTKVGSKIIYHDSFTGNQDPYVWNEKFLHTYCHITQMKPEEGYINFWVSGDKFPEFNKLFCDLVFVVKEKKYWHDRNKLCRNDRIIDSEDAYHDHYIWPTKGQHEFDRRRRYTLKADPDLSFQPQTKTGDLIDIIPIITEFIPINILREKITRKGKDGKTSGSKPVFLSTLSACSIYQYLCDCAEIQLRGRELKAIYQNIKQKKS